MYGAGLFFRYWYMMMKIKNIILASLLVASSSAFALDKSSDHYKAAIELMGAADATTMLTQARRQMNGMLDARMQQLQTKIPPEKQEEFDQYKLNVSGLMRKNMRWGKLKDEFAELYMEIYTKGELKELTKFYESAVGKKFVKRTPELMQRTVKIMQGRMASMMPEIQKLTNELQESVRGEQ